MSAISRLFKWAPCFWALTKLANSSSQAQRAQVVHSHSSAAHQRNGPLNVLQTLSFSARSVVQHGRVVRPVLPPREPVTLVLHASAPKWLPNWLRHRRSEVHHGWRWENPPFSAVAKVHSFFQRASSTIASLLNASRDARLPLELELAVVRSLAYSARMLQKGVSIETRLVNSRWNNNLRKAYWKTRWFLVRPEVASWPSLSRRLRFLIENSSAIHSVKLNGVLTDIFPVSIGRAVEACPELARLGECNIREISVGRLDHVNEVVLKMMLSTQQANLRHFSFRAKDTFLFFGRLAMFPDSNMHMPQLRKVSIDISTSPNDEYLDLAFGSMAMGLSVFIAALFGREAGRRVSINIVCMPDIPDPARPYISERHLTLARDLTAIARAFMSDAHVATNFSFEAPLQTQATSTLNNILAWAETDGVRLVDVPVPNSNVSVLA